MSYVCEATTFFFFSLSRMITRPVPTTPNHWAVFVPHHPTGLLMMPPKFGRGCARAKKGGPFSTPRQRASHARRTQVVQLSVAGSFAVALTPSSTRPRWCECLFCLGGLPPTQFWPQLIRLCWWAVATRLVRKNVQSCQSSTWG